jgi:hypothetical protein
MMEFEILGEITDIETIAVGKAIRELPRVSCRVFAGNTGQVGGAS